MVPPGAADGGGSERERAGRGRVAVERGDSAHGSAAGGGRPRRHDGRHALAVDGLILWRNPARWPQIFPPPGEMSLPRLIKPAV